jgi:hypothetical protein
VHLDNDAEYLRNTKLFLILLLDLLFLNSSNHMFFIGILGA